MKFSKKMYITVMIGAVFSLIFAGGVLAGPTVDDIPSSENEVRIISGQNTIYGGMCDIPQQYLAFYEGSDVYLRVAQPQTVVNYAFDKAITYIRLYGDKVFTGTLKFPYVSNFVPSATQDPTNTLILSVIAKDGKFNGWTGIVRNKVAGQIVTKNMLRNLILSNAGQSINYYYRYSSDNSLHNGTIKALINPTVTEKTTCTSYYVARCGDEVVDTPTGSSDGAGGIQTESNGFIAWFQTSLKPTEQCDDGNTVSGDGCSSTCQNEFSTPPTCNSVTVNPTSGSGSTAFTYTCNGTNATGYSLTLTNASGTITTGFVGAGPATWTFTNLPEGSNAGACTVYGMGSSAACTTPATATVSTTVIPPSTTALQITKTLLTSATVRPGDLVSFRIDFKNIGSGIANNVSIEDAFPGALTYIDTGTELVGVMPPYNKVTFMSGGVFFVGYKGFTLTPGQAGYMIIKGIAKGRDRVAQNGNQGYNFSYIFGDNAPLVPASAYFTYAVPNASISVSKVLTTYGTIYPGAVVGFMITIQNNGDSVNNLSIQDVWPNSPCIIPSGIYTSNVPLTLNGNYSWAINGAFNPGQGIVINMTGQIKNDPVCGVAGTYTNTANYSYTLGGVVHTGSSVLPFTVVPTPYANIDFLKTVLQAGSAKGDIVSYKITYRNNGTSPLQGFVITDFRPATLNYVSSSPLPSNPPYNNSCAAGCNLNYYIPGTLQPQQVGEIILTGTIK